jgi:hypothetical protein
MGLRFEVRGSKAWNQVRASPVHYGGALLIA